MAESLSLYSIAEIFASLNFVNFNLNALAIKTSTHIFGSINLSTESKMFDSQFFFSQQIPAIYTVYTLIKHMI